MVLSDSTAIVPFGIRDALCLMSRSNAPMRRRHLFISWRAPGSSAGLPAYLIGSPLEVVRVTDLFSASLCAVDDVLVLMVGHSEVGSWTAAT